MAKMMTLTNPNTPDRPASEEIKTLRQRFAAPDLRQALKALGPGWQMLTDGGLAEAVRRHHLPMGVGASLGTPPLQPVSFAPGKDL